MVVVENVVAVGHVDEGGVVDAYDVGVACDHRDEDGDDDDDEVVASTRVSPEVVASLGTWVLEGTRTWATKEHVPFLLPVVAQPLLPLPLAIPWDCTAATVDIHAAAGAAQVERQDASVVKLAAIVVVVAAAVVAIGKSIVGAISKRSDAVAVQRPLHGPRKSGAEDVHDRLELEVQLARTVIPRAGQPQAGCSLACFLRIPPTLTNVLMSLGLRQVPERFDFPQHHEYHLPDRVVRLRFPQ